MEVFMSILINACSNQIFKGVLYHVHVYTVTGFFYRFIALHEPDTRKAILCPVM